MPLLLALALGCAGGRTNGPEVPPTDAPDPALPAGAQDGKVMKIPGSRAAPRAEYAGWSTEFALDLHRALRVDGENTASSGPSALIAFSLLGLGARGATRDELSAMFGAPHDEAWHIDNERVVTAWHDTRGVKLASANAVWVDEGAALSPEYVEQAGTHYGTSPSNLTFSADPAKAAAAIDAWAKEKTWGMIERVFAPEDLRGAPLVLANAVAFQGRWASRFDSEATAPSAFSVRGAPVDVPTMRQRLQARHTDGDGWAAVVLPYEGESTSMIVLLPDAGTSVASVEDALTADLLSRLPEGPLVQVDLALPKFTFAVDHDLNAPIAALGAPSLFGAPDLSGLGLGRIAVSKAIQKVFVKVDEEGTEAAAVTAIATKRSAGPGPAVVPFTVDRPFVFAILHHETRVPLFVGRVEDPRG